VDFHGSLTPKEEEIIVDEVKGKDKAYFEDAMIQAMKEGHRVLASEGIGMVVFAHTDTMVWETQLQAMIDAG
jgi:adenine-specific DNA methylase